MGQGQSTGGTSGVPLAVVSSRTKEQERAYNQGVEDSSKQMNAILSQVADQVYSNVTSQLSDLQEKKLESSTMLSENLRRKIAPIAHHLSTREICVHEHKSLLECLQLNPKEPTRCSALVDALSICANKSL